jgi:hypothetical protein
MGVGFSASRGRRTGASVTASIAPDISGWNINDEAGLRPRPRPR